MAGVPVRRLSTGGGGHSPAPPASALLRVNAWLVLTAAERLRRAFLPPGAGLAPVCLRQFCHRVEDGLLAEVEVAHDAPVWRDADNGSGVTLVATEVALTALGIEADERH